MASFSTGLSALTAGQRLLEVAGQNIANAATPGYHRQVARLAVRPGAEMSGVTVGTGVDVTSVDRLRDSLVEMALTSGLTTAGETAARLAGLRQIEALLPIDNGSLHDALEQFFNSLEQLTARPDDVTVRRLVLDKAGGLARQFNHLAGSLTRMRSELADQATRLATEINDLTRRIAQLNASIYRSEVRGVHANNLADRRDQLINELAQRVGVQTVEQDYGVVTVQVGGALVAGATRSLAIQTAVDADGQLVVTTQGGSTPLPVSGGRLGGLLHLYNQAVPGYQSSIDTLALALITQVNAVHATGVGLSGPFDVLFSSQPVADVSAPLAQLELPSSPGAGVLVIGVTDKATGQRVLEQVAIDPQSDSLSDLAAAVSAVDHLSALADPQTGRLRIVAEPGYGFDFAGGLQSQPDTANISGTVVPSVGGAYSGSTNQTLTVTAVGTGTVGVTAGLMAEVRDQSGQLVGRLDIGADYEPGSPLTVVDGITVSLTSGTVNDGDNFTITAVADPDTSGILAALGLNGFWSGTDAASMAVGSQLLQTPELLAASRTGLPGDGSNAQRLAALRDAPLLGPAGQSFREFYAALVGQIGAQVHDADSEQGIQDRLLERLQAQRQSASGVDTNEQLVRLLQAQRQFQAAARYIATLNQVLQDVIRIL